PAWCAGSRPPPPRRRCSSTSCSWPTARRSMMCGYAGPSRSPSIERPWRRTIARRWRGPSLLRCGPADRPAGRPLACLRPASAGWLDLNGDGTRERGGHRLQVVTMVSDAAEPTRERVIAAMRELGFFVDERVGSPAVLLNRMVAGRFDLGFMTWRGPADGDL